MCDAPALVPVNPIGADEVDVDLVDYCARPMCRREFRQSAGRGRRRDYCSEECRRLADRDYKRSKATVEHFERLARRQRYDVLAFGRSVDGTDLGPLSVESATAAAAASVARAEAVLRFVGDADPRLVDELKALLEGIRPLVSTLASRPERLE
jgi:hypothetical protein